MDNQHGMGQLQVRIFCERDLSIKLGPLVYPHVAVADRVWDSVSVVADDCRHKRVTLYLLCFLVSAIEPASEVFKPTMTP